MAYAVGKARCGLSHSGSLLMKIVAVIIMLVILGSLASALVFLIKDEGKTKRTVNALTVRISLSVVLFLFLMFGYWMGWFRSSHPLG